LLFLVVYGVIFLRELVKANLDVAFRVLNPSLPIHPGIVEVKTKMSSPIGKLLLANSITLTPGTLTLDVKGDRMFIHWIDVRGQDIDQSTGMIVGAFEKTLREVVE
jgi:multicomponent Na+:H+ antiporter subunit E